MVPRAGTRDLGCQRRPDTLGLGSLGSLIGVPFGWDSLVIACDCHMYLKNGGKAE